eukprot:g62570.t1
MSMGNNHSKLHFLWFCDLNAGIMCFQFLSQKSKLQKPQTLEQSLNKADYVENRFQDRLRLLHRMVWSEFDTERELARDGVRMPGATAPNRAREQRQRTQALLQELRDATTTTTKRTKSEQQASTPGRADKVAEKRLSMDWTEPLRFELGLEEYKGTPLQMERYAQRLQVRVKLSRLATLGKSGQASLFWWQRDQKNQVFSTPPS